MASMGSSNWMPYHAAILTITGITAALGIYYVYHRNPSTGLHRSGAIYRRRGRRRTNEGTQSQQHETTQDNENARQSENPTQQDDAPANPEGVGPEEVTVHWFGGELDLPIIAPASIPEETYFQNTLDVSMDTAREVRNDVHVLYVYRYLLENEIPVSFIDNDDDIRVLSRMLIDSGFEIPAVHAAISQFHNNRHPQPSLYRALGLGDPERPERTPEAMVHYFEQLQLPHRLFRELLEPDSNENFFEVILDTNEERPTTITVEPEHLPVMPADDPDSGQSLLNLLYHIAEDQARREGCVHRGVTCNSCGMAPIRGIRYRCTNCVDFDLCETCEALQVHEKTHLFYKVRIPAPFLGSPRQIQPVTYPGKPRAFPATLSQQMVKNFAAKTGFEYHEIEALYEQFKCLASTPYPESSHKLFKLGIDRSVFDKCFIPLTAHGYVSPNLVCDRIFAFFDVDHDRLIGFDEFLEGSACLQRKSRDARIARVFKGYDIDDDGFVTRKDFLRMFRAFYALTREFTKDFTVSLEEDSTEVASYGRSIIQTSQALSAAFPGRISDNNNNREGEGKEVNEHGDQEIVDGEGVVLENSEDHADFNEVISDIAEQRRFGSIGSNTETSPEEPSMFVAEVSTNEMDVNAVEAILETVLQRTRQYEAESPNNFESTRDRWPPRDVTEEDVQDALGAQVPIEQITNEEERTKVRRVTSARLREESKAKRASVRRAAVQERFERREFYIDEEDGVPVPDGVEDNVESANESSDDGPASRRSRSSSKVRFEDDVTDTDYETRSNHSTSSRSIPHGERWGGYEIPEPERDVGKEIIYQVTQAGFNELIDCLFKDKEDLALECKRTRSDRLRWAKELEEYKQSEEWRIANIQTASRVPTYSDWIKLRDDSETQANSDTNEDEPAEVSRASAERGLQTLLNDAGYSLSGDVNEANFVRPPQPEYSRFTPPQRIPQITTVEVVENDIPVVDPTLPQNRPNGPISPSVTLPVNSPKSKKREEHPAQKEEVREKPSKSMLERLALMEVIETEANKRRLWASLSFKEFKDIIEERRDDCLLGYLSNWIDLASV